MNLKQKQDKFLELFEQINDSLYLYARALTKNNQDAEDLLSDSIVASYEKFDNLNDFSKFKSYIFKTMRSLHIQKKRRLWIFGIFDSNSYDELISDHAPDLPVDACILYQKLDLLPKQQKEAIILFEISGFSIKEIQELQGGTISGVKSRLKRGKEKLRELLLEKENNVLLKDYSKEIKGVI